MANHLFDLVRANATDLTKTFIETETGLKLTYGDLMTGTARYANVLAGLGVKPGDRVAVQVEKSAGAIFLYLACVRAGAVFLPLNTAYTLTEIEYFLGDAEPALVVCDPARRDGIAGVAKKTGVPAVETLGKGQDGSLFDKAAAASETFIDVARAPDDLAAILYTSGTTGRSKGAMLSHDNLASNALTLKDYWRFGADDVLLHALPIFHTHGLFVATNTILVAGASMLFLPKFDADKVFELMPRATTMMGVPTFYVRLVQDHRLTREATKHMRLFISGSAPLLAETHKLFREKTGVSILERYGMTETNMNTSNPYDGDRVAGTVGFPLPGVALRVADPETGAAIAQGEIGVIEVKGPNV
ncbi:MAG: AMP-binding protein, partial [Phreatobacter sp.]